MRKFEVKFGEVIQESYRNIPQLPIIVIDEQGNEISAGYLTPFRRYCFQVSGDTCGNADYGSSNVINLMALYPLEENMRKEMLKGQIAIAIETFLTRGYVEFPCRRSSGNEEYTIVRPDYNPVFYESMPEDTENCNAKNYLDFIEKCDKWLFD